MSVQSSRTPAPARSWPRFQFVRDVISELRKTTWPTRKEAGYLTALVMVVSLSVGGILYVVDLAFSEIVTKLVLK